MIEKDTADFLGRKIFFLHPSVLVQNQVITELAQEEFETYSVKDEVRLRQFLKRHPDSIVFACINEGMKESAWENWIKAVLTDSEITGLDIGIIASGDDANLRQKYMGQYKLRCGYTVLKSDVPSVIKQLIHILNSANAKGRRKYVRAVTSNETNITANFPVNGTFVNGHIRDISTVGFSCCFTEDPDFTKNSLFNDIQLRLQSQLLKVEGIVFGSRPDGPDKIYVIIFSQRTSPDVRTKIRKFVHSFLQHRMDNDLK